MSANDNCAQTNKDVNSNDLTPTTELIKYKEMMLEFRVIELEKVLSFLQLPIYGLKKQLQSRILTALENNFDLASKIIQEVYTIFRCKIPRKRGGQIQANTTAAQVQNQNLVQSSSQLSYSTTDNTNAAAVALNTNHLQEPTPTTASSIVLSENNFFDKMLFPLIESTILIPFRATAIQESNFQFTLTLQQVKQIKTTIGKQTNTFGGRVKLYIRFVRGSSGQGNAHIAKGLIVTVNDNICVLPSSERLLIMVDVTSKLKLIPTAINKLNIMWRTDVSEHDYMISLFFEEKPTAEQLLNHIIKKGIQPAERTRNLIKEKLNDDLIECEVATTMLKISLICPLSKMKMSKPCRASTCTHLQCFDALFFLQMNERKPTWQCPVCYKPATYETLMIDGYFQEVLSSTLIQASDTEIQLHKDGSWGRCILNLETFSLDSPGKAPVKAKQKRNEIAKSSRSTRFQVKKEVETNNNVIDLTTNDARDDLLLARPKQQQTLYDLLRSNKNQTTKKNKLNH